MGMSSNTSSSNIQQAAKRGNSGNPMISPSNMEIGKIYGNKCDLNIIQSIQQTTKLGNEDIGWILIVRYKYVYDSVSDQSTDVPKPPHHPMFFGDYSVLSFTSSTAQGGGGSFKNRKPIGEIGCCESGMAERIH